MENKSCRKTLAETSNFSKVRGFILESLNSRKFNVCLWHGFLCHFWPTEGIGDAVPSFKSDTSHMSKMCMLAEVLCEQLCHPINPRVFKGHTTGVLRTLTQPTKRYWQSRDLHWAMRCQTHVNPVWTCSCLRINNHLDGCKQEPKKVHHKKHSGNIWKLLENHESYLEVLKVSWKSWNLLEEVLKVTWKLEISEVAYLSGCRWVGGFEDEQGIYANLFGK